MKPAQPDLAADDRVASTLGSPWLSPSQAATYLGVPLHDLLPLVEAGQLRLFSAPDHGLRLHMADLDAALLPVPPSEARRLLGAQVAATPTAPMPPSPSSTPAAATTGSLLSLHEAAIHLNKPYKTLLRLVHGGKIPATNLGTATRPRYVVDPEAIKRIWASEAQRDMRSRSAPAASLDYARILGRAGREG